MWKWSFSKKVDGIVIYNPDTREIIRDGAGRPQTFRRNEVQGIVDQMNSDTRTGEAGV